MKRWFGSLLICLIIVGLLGTPSALGVPGKKFQKHIPSGQFKKFVDSMEVPWAEETIEKMARLGIIAGYPDGKFLPNKPVTQLEALIMAMRVFGWSAANNKDSSLWDEIRENDIPLWGMGSVITAIQKGILPDNLENFKPNKPATRAEVADLIIKALAAAEQEDLSEFEDFINRWSEKESVWFIDENEIPRMYRNHVRFIARLGIMVGGTDGSFQPNKPVTRAEMAALLYRLRLMIMEGINIDEEVDKTEIAGYIVYTALDDDIIYVLSGNDLLEVELSGDIEISRNGVELDEDDWDKLKICDKVIIEKEDDEIVKVSAIYYGGRVKITGEIEDIDDNEITLQVKYGDINIYYTYPVNEDFDLEGYEEGDDVEITLRRGEVVDLCLIINP